MTRRETYARDATILQEARFQRGQFKVQFSAGQSLQNWRRCDEQN